MRTKFTQNDMRKIFEDIYNEFTDKDILTTDENNQNQQKVNLKDYLNIQFYTWKNRLVDKGGEMENAEEWLESLNYSINESYGLCEITNMTATASQDINSGEITGRITFLVQADKMTLLEDTTAEIRNSYLGKATPYTDNLAQQLDLYINLSNIFYDGDPDMTQMGECFVCYANFVINYLQKANNYENTIINFSINNGNYMEFPFVKASWHTIYNNQAVTTQGFPNRVGAVNTSVSATLTLSYYDFNESLNAVLDQIFWQTIAYSKNVGDTETPLTPQEINIPCKIRVDCPSGVYYYKMVITEMQKDIANGDFNTNVISFRLSGK